MVAQDNDVKHGDVNSRQEVHQEDENFKIRNEHIQQTQSYFLSALEIWTRSSRRNWIVWLRTQTGKHSVT